MSYFHLDLDPIFAGGDVRIRLGPVSILIDGDPVALSEAEEITFRIKARAGDAEPALLEKDLEDGIEVDGDYLNIDLVPLDTAALGRRFPHHYEYNVIGTFGGQVKFLVFPSRIPIRSAV